LAIAPNSQFSNAVGIQPQQQQITSLFASSNYQPTSSASIPQFGPAYATAPLNHPTSEQQHHLPPVMLAQVNLLERFSFFTFPIFRCNLTIFTDHNNNHY
jgi:hypothetical protein